VTGCGLDSRGSDLCRDRNFFLFDFVKIWDSSTFLCTWSWDQTSSLYSVKHNSKNQHNVYVTITSALIIKITICAILAFAAFLPTDKNKIMNKDNQYFDHTQTQHSNANACIASAVILII
jgi:hypothetical protein